MKKLSLGAFVFLASALSVANGQAPPTIHQQSEKSICSNIVALTGDLKINCSSLTKEQRKALKDIPAVLKMAVTNQSYLTTIIAKMEEMSKASSTVTNFAPGGFATSGGTLLNPTVINNRPIPPALEVSAPVVIAPKPTYPYSNGVPDMSKTPIGMSRPGVSVTVDLKGVFINPAIVADCSVPCTLVEQGFISPGTFSSKSEDYNVISTGDHMGAGVSFTANQLYPGRTIYLEFQSLDDRPLSISNVRPLVQ